MGNEGNEIERELEIVPQELRHVCEYCSHEFDLRAAFGRCPRCGGRCLIVAAALPQQRTVLNVSNYS